MTSQKLKQSGFTIVELLIVIVVIGILATIAFVSYGNVTRKARDSERTADVKAMASKAEEYYATNGSYPADCAALTGLQGLNAESYKAPNGATNSCDDSAPTSTNDVYRYTTQNNNGSFTIVYWDEPAGTTATKTVTSSN